VTERVLFSVIAEKSGVTAAGPLPSLTGFPIKLSHLTCFLKRQRLFVKNIMALSNSIHKPVLSAFSGRTDYRQCPSHLPDGLADAVFIFNH
jgi:hypothetical protein